MKYSYKFDLPHPGFVVIDSPLTTYRRNDQTPEEKSEDVPIDIQNEFFENLSFEKDKQIIVLENKEPEESLKEKINYVHFTGVEKVNRKGFYPINLNSQ